MLRRLGWLIFATTACSNGAASVGDTDGGRIVDAAGGGAPDGASCPASVPDGPCAPVGASCGYGCTSCTCTSAGWYCAEPDCAGGCTGMPNAPQEGDPCGGCCGVSYETQCVYTCAGGQQSTTATCTASGWHLSPPCTDAGATDAGSFCQAAEPKAHPGLIPCPEAAATPALVCKYSAGASCSSEYTCQCIEGLGGPPTCSWTPRGTVCLDAGAD